MGVNLIMEECMYCGVHSYENMFSLKKFADGSYCSLKCVSEDIKNHEQFIATYENDISSIRKKILDHKYGRNPLSKEEVNELENKLTMYRQKQVVLLQKLPLMRTLLKTGKLRYREHK